jgi:hypothetical protein
MKILRWAFLLALLCFFVGMLGAISIWMDSSAMPTDQYTHRYEMHMSRWNNDMRAFYMTDEQESSFGMLSSLMYVGLWSVFGVVIAMKVIRVAAKDRSG